MSAVTDKHAKQTESDSEGTTNRHHNFLAHAAESIRERTAKAKEASFESLVTQVSVGDLLNEIKETLEKGAFGRWCDEQGFDFDKSWRARLMKLAANWEAAKAAMEALPENKRKWTVEAVLKALADSQKAEHQTATADGNDDIASSHTTGRNKRMTEAEKLRQALAEALERIQSLESEIDTLKGSRNEGYSSESYKRAYEANEKRKQGHEERQQARDKAAKVDPATKVRASKVWNLYSNPGTDGERAAARERLESMAEKCGLDFDTFIKACGLS